MQAFSQGSRALAMTAATARMVSVRIPDTNRPPVLRLAEPLGPAVVTPAVESPAVESPAVESPAVESPAVESPGRESPVRRAVSGALRNPTRWPTAKPTATRPSGPVSLLARAQLADAHRGLDRSMQSQDIADRYAAAHLGALRGAAALLATRPKPATRTLKHASVWVLMTKVAPELEEWANYFAAGSAKRKAAEAGISRLISDQDAAEMVRQTAQFLELIEQLIQQ